MNHAVIPSVSTVRFWPLPGMRGAEVCGAPKCRCRASAYHSLRPSSSRLNSSDAHPSKLLRLLYRFQTRCQLAGSTSTKLPGDLDGLLGIQLGVDFRRPRVTIAQNRLGTIQAKQLPHIRSRRVAQTVWRPATLPLPLLLLLALHALGGRKGTVAGPLDGAAVCCHLVTIVHLGDGPFAFGRHGLVAAVQGRRTSLVLSDP